MAVLGMLLSRRDWAGFEDHLKIALPKSIKGEELTALLNSLDAHCSPPDLAEASAIAKRICDIRSYENLLRQHGIDD
jgi:hypothetical protein